MANKKTVALTLQQYESIITTMRTGGAGFRANDRIATALVLEANLGMRIEDILQLKLSDIIKDGTRYRLNITEKKTGKERSFTVPLPIYNFIQGYCLDKKIGKDEIMINLTKRAIQKYLAKVVDYLGYEEVIGTHSFRKFFATEIYNKNGYDIVLVQKLLQHSSVATTQKYIGVDAKVEDALQNHIHLI